MQWGKADDTDEDVLAVSFYASRGTRHGMGGVGVRGIALESQPEVTLATFCADLIGLLEEEGLVPTGPWHVDVVRKV